VTALHSVNFLYSLSGFFVGMLVGMTGVGLRVWQLPNASAPSKKFCNEGHDS
jgi:hypothetical protein